MAIGSLDRAGRIEQLRTFARCQVWAAYRSPAEIRAEVYDAVLAELRAGDDAAAFTDQLIVEVRAEHDAVARSWPSTTGYDRLSAAFNDLRANDVVVLEAVDDHWTASETLARLADEGRRPTGILYFTHPDVWHCVEHGMLELNVWHGDTANVGPGDDLLDVVLHTLGDNGIEAIFDEGRIEATLDWQRA